MFQTYQVRPVLPRCTHDMMFPARDVERYSTLRSAYSKYGAQRYVGLTIGNEVRNLHQRLAKWLIKPAQVNGSPENIYNGLCA